MTQTAGTVVYKEGQTPLKPRYQPTGKVPTQEAGDTEYNMEAVVLGCLETGISPITPNLTPGSPNS